MNLTLTLENRFQQTPDGAIWTQSPLTCSFWQRYLSVFTGLNILARIEQVSTISDDFHRSDCDGVTFMPLPYYVGSLQYIQKILQLRRVIKETMQASQAVIMRVPSPIASDAISAMGNHQPFGLEVVGDPYDVFAPGSVHHPFRAYFRWSFARQLRQQCQQASAVTYVTAQALQKHYPSEPSAFTTHYSDIELHDEAFVNTPQQLDIAPDVVRLAFVGSLEQLYKAPDVLIDAVARCVSQGVAIHLTMIGDGKYRSELEAQVTRLGLQAQVKFTGMLPAGDAVRDELDKAHIFVLPSKTEGLPRAMIEAMARGLPCIGSTVGGIPELLPIEAIVTPGDVHALADKIMEVASNPQRMSTISARNLAVARDYHEDILQARRIEFYNYLKEKTVLWLKQRQ